MDAYATPDAINLIPVGRLATLWNALSTTQQAQLLRDASSSIDLYTGQYLGLWDGERTVDRAVHRDLDTLFLPNTPVTAVTALQVTAPPGGQDRDLLCAADTIRLSGGQSFIYRPQTTGPFVDSRRPFPAGSIVTVTYRSGFLPGADPNAGGLPGYLSEAIRLVVGEMLTRVVDNPSGATALSQGGAHLMFFRGVNAAIDRVMDLISAIKVEGMG